MRRVLGLVVAVAGCGSGANQLVQADASSADAPAVIDAPTSFAACNEFDVAGMVVPVHVSGMLGSADLTAPAMCAVIDAPFGVESAGPDSVVRIDGLVEGTSYVVSLDAVSDLAFYVATGCSTPTGPSSAECQLFEDATSSGVEVGTFVAQGSVAYVVVDYFASAAPPDLSYTLDVYEQGCTNNPQCETGTPVCLAGQCVQCATSFDCTAPSAPLCDDTTHTCIAGADMCTTDDAGEPDNNGPAGAPHLSIDGFGNGGTAGMICSNPAASDFVAFDVQTVGETWKLQLQWSGTADLDLEIFDAKGNPVGLSLWEQPEQVRMTYLLPGTYYAQITEFSTNPDPTAVAYTISAHRTLGAGCASSADCAAEYRNQIYRGECSAGSCIDIPGAGTVGQGGACDSQSDCASGLDCPSFFFVANADTRDTCEPGCSGDSDCAALGTGFVCTTYLQDNFCVDKCTVDAQCPTAVDSPPNHGPWFQLRCDVPTGRCLP